METHAYPGRGLSLSQLVFALNEELKRVEYSPLYVAKAHFGLIEELHVLNYRCSFTLEAVSQLDRDASIALATIREWKNSFAHVNRIPTDILSLIPTHLSSQKDRFYAASVCRHWRGVLIKRGALWSQLFLKRGEDYVSTLLARAKGSALEVIAHRDAPAVTIELISPRAQQIRHLEFIRNRWQDITTFSEFNSGQLPLLRTLKIIFPDALNPDGQPNVATPPSFPFFRGSTDLKQFVFCFSKLSLLSHFVFPNLTTLELSSYPTEESNASYLLDFLQVSPTLQTVQLRICAKIVLTNVSQGTVVILPNVETFSLHVTDDPMTDVYDIAAHISCPCARYTSLTHEIDDNMMSANLEVFPNPVSWSTIIRQYTATPVEEVTLEIKHEYEDIKCFLTFRSSETTAVKLGFQVTESGLGEDQLNMPHAEMGWEIFSKALKAIQYHPLLPYIKRLHIEYKASVSNAYKMLRMAEEVRDLFNSLKPLDELTIRGCDLHIFLAAFLDGPGLDELEQPVVFPQIKDLTILHPEMEGDDMECMDAIVELAKLQHALAIPFERVTVRMWSFPEGMVEELKRWVGAVDCCEEWYEEE